MINTTPRLSELTMVDGTRLASLLPGIEHGAFRTIEDRDCYRVIGVRPDGRMVSAVMDRFLPMLDISHN